MQKRFWILKAAIILLIALAAGCTKSSGGGSSDNSSSSNIDDLTTDGFGLKAECGAVVNGTYTTDTIAYESAKTVSSVQIISPELAEVSTTEGETFLVKFHGITDKGVRDFSRKKGIELAQNTAGFGGYFLPAGDECAVTLSGGGRGVFGKLYTSAGESLNEILVKNGGAVPDATDPCNGDMLAACYDTLSVNEPVSEITINDFLWKPVAENNGNVVVLVNPLGVTVHVNGETFRNTGPSNGRGTTARGSKPGCAYGQATVTFTDSEGAPVLLADGRDSVVLNGCDRVQFTL